ncbi:CsbD family protein [Flavobacterium ardleyense]|uniref:CsbD family protein n=1 Tax=Flavobacterium ardleyense TaxID=2038737 RepID=A0ABW5Z697_9FLAO
MESSNELDGKWKEMKGKLKQKIAELTDDHLLLVKGRKDEIVGRLQIELGKSEEEIDGIISDL